MITKQIALTHNTFYSKTARYRSGNRGFYRIRRNGKTQTWKSRPNDFRIPALAGFKQHIQITQHNANDFLPYDPQWCLDVGLTVDAPWQMVSDLLEDAGRLSEANFIRFLYTETQATEVVLS